MRAQENKCQISQNDILHMKFSVTLVLKIFLCFHYSCEIWPASYPGQFALSELRDLKLGTECDSARCPRRIFPASLIGEVTYEIAKDDWDKTEIWHLFVGLPRDIVFGVYYYIYSPWKM